MAEQSLQEIAKREEAIERLLTGRKPDQEVDVAVGTRLVPQDGAEESEASCTEAKNLSLDFPEALPDLLTGECFWHGLTVTQKCVIAGCFCNTLIPMANIVSADKQVAVIGALAEGSSIRAIERITGIDRDTIMRLGVRVGEGAGSHRAGIQGS